MKKVLALVLSILIIAALLTGCGAADREKDPAVPYAEDASSGETAPTDADADSGSEPSSDGGSAEGEGTADVPTEKNGDVVILFTSDVHCGVDQGFGYAGLQQIRDTLEADGFTTILVDDGDAVQGEAIGTLSKGEAIIGLMNDLHYDAAIPGNHEFDYGMEQFLKLADMAEFPYISCNFNKEGESIFDPYVIIEAAGMKIGFVGVTTPQTLSSSTPAYFQNDAGEYVYGFLQDDTGEGLYNAVQDAVDGARADGAEYIYVLGHLGLGETYRPWTYADVIEHTNGIDVLLDGHSHDTEQVVMKNKDGDDVVRSACGTKLNCIGYSRISAADGITDTGIWSWPNTVSSSELFGIDNAVSEKVDAALDELNAQLGTMVARSSVLLTINDPVETDSSGNPIRMVRRAETNLGDLCADAFREASGADIALVNGGGIRTSIAQGDITYGDIISVFPFGNMLCVIEATGQQILDALEWSASRIPNEFGGFLQVSGLTCEIDVSVPSGCVADENNMLISIQGERRVKNVMIGGAPLDPNGIYTVAGTDYLLLDSGDGHTAFDGDTVLLDCVQLDNQLLIDYIVDRIGGEVGGDYSDPGGQGRITIYSAPEE